MTATLTSRPRSHGSHGTSELTCAVRQISRRHFVEEYVSIAKRWISEDGVELLGVIEIDEEGRNRWSFQFRKRQVRLAETT